MYNYVNVRKSNNECSRDHFFVEKNQGFSHPSHPSPLEKHLSNKYKKSQWKANSKTSKPLINAT